MLYKKIVDAVVLNVTGGNSWVTVTINANPNDIRPIDLRRFI